MINNKQQLVLSYGVTWLTTKLTIKNFGKLQIYKTRSKNFTQNNSIFKYTKRHFKYFISFYVCLINSRIKKIISISKEKKVKIAPLSHKYGEQNSSFIYEMHYNLVICKHGHQTLNLFWLEGGSDNMMKWSMEICRNCLF